MNSNINNESKLNKETNTHKQITFNNSSLKRNLIKNSISSVKKKKYWWIEWSVAGRIKASQIVRRTKASRMASKLNRYELKRVKWIGNGKVRTVRLGFGDGEAGFGDGEARFWRRWGMLRVIGNLEWLRWGIRLGIFFFFWPKWPLKCFVALGLFFGVLGIEIRLISL